MEQFYKLTLADAISRYQAGDLTAKGLVHFYILIKCKPEWKIRLEPEKVCKELGIQKTAFYNAISRLRSEGSIEWEAPKGILVSLSISPTFRECGMDSAIAETDSAIAETDSAIAETDSAIAETDSAIAETKSSEPSLDKGCSDSPDLLLDSYQIFINSLSDSERENFLEFGKKKAAQLPQPPGLPLKWIEAYFEELRSQWNKQNGVVPSSKNWKNDPRCQEWLDKIRSLGFAAFIYEDGDLDEERKEFYEWANSKNLIWVDFQSTNVDSQSMNVDSQSTIVDSKSPEPSSDKGCSDSPDSYQIFINSLSDSERENFLEFGKKKAAQLPQPPGLPLKWIEAHFEELRSQWNKQNGVVRSSKNWKNDPRCQEWLDKIRSLGFAAFIYEDGDLDEERKEFYLWANSKNLIWGAEL